MNFHQLLQTSLTDSLGPSLTAFRPELALCATIVVLLLARIVAPEGKLQAYVITLAGALAALWYAAPWQLSAAAPTAEQTFTGMLVFDSLAVYMRAVVLAFVVLLTVLTWITNVPRRADSTEFFTLVLGAAVGMCLMVSANHMLIVLLGIEMASVPSYALAGMLKQRRAGSEAALKFAVYGAGTAGVMLYGMSLLIGALGSAHLPTMAGRLAELLASTAGREYTLVLVLGGLMLMVGVAFKLSAFPFHFWAPDVFEGASAEVAAFLSVASKAAALTVLVRLALGLTTAADPAAMTALEPARQYAGAVIALFAAVTCTFGNLAAYGQTNIKRLLAYSTIAHAGYMMMAVAATVMLAGKHPEASRLALAGLAFYAGVYLFMNLGAFAGVAALRNACGSEQIDDYAGLVRRSPGLALCMAVILFSLVGLPPLAGFAGKFAIFVSLASSDPRLLTLLVIGGLNTALSLFYYLRVVRVMTLTDEPDGRPAPTVSLASLAGLYCLAVTAPVVVLGIWWNGLFGWATVAASKLFLS